jgi:hypothetical protein
MAGVTVTIVLPDGSLRKRRISSDSGLDRLLSSLNVQWLLDVNSAEIEEYGSLEDGQTYTLGTAQPPQVGTAQPPQVAPTYLVPAGSSSGPNPANGGGLAGREMVFATCFCVPKL